MRVIALTNRKSRKRQKIRSNKNNNTVIFHKALNTNVFYKRCTIINGIGLLDAKFQSNVNFNIKDPLQ